MDANDGFDDEGPFSPWVSPDDRLWRHPSESAGAPTQPFALQSMPPTRSSASRPWATALAAGVVGALLASGIGVVTGGFVHTTVVRPLISLISPTTTTPTEAASISSDNPPLTTSWSSVYSQLVPSMVMISGNGDAGEVYTSGLLWKTDASGETAYILAANDELQGMGTVSLTFANGRAQGKVVGTDAQTGLAVVSVAQRSLPPSAYFPALGSLTDIHVGDSLATVGSGTDAGTGQSGSIAVGQVSSLYQTVDTDSGLGMVGLIAVGNTLPLDSGAAVVESDGAVVGLTVDGGSDDIDSQQVSYAVPMDLASTIAAELVNGQRPWHPWIGVLQAQDFPAALASSMGLSGGAIVESVSPGSPAAQAGLSPSDVIISLGNTPITSTGNLLEVLDQCSGQSRLTLRYLQGGKPVTTSITVTAQPANPASP